MSDLCVVHMDIHIHMLLMSTQSNYSSRQEFKAVSHFPRKIHVHVPFQLTGSVLMYVYVSVFCSS